MSTNFFCFHCKQYYTDMGYLIGIINQNIFQGRKNSVVGEEMNCFGRIWFHIYCKNFTSEATKKEKKKKGA